MARWMRWISSNWCWITSLTDGRLLAISLIAFTGGAEAADLRCIPALPVFCANVHIGCSGRTVLPTQEFSVSPTRITFSDGSGWRVDQAVSDSGSVYRRQGAKDWVRINPKGAFSQRIYRENGPLMTYGRCE